MISRPVPGRRTALAVVLPSVVLLVPTAAHAQTPTAPAPAAPVATKLTLATEKARGGEALRGEKWRALVVADQFVADTKVRLTFTAGKKSVLRTLVLEQQKKGGEKGFVRFTVPKKLQNSSRVVVRASVPEGQPTAATTAKQRVVLQANPNVRSGEKGLYDARTQRAVLAFRKVAGMAATSEANSAVFRALRAGKGTFKVRFPSHGRHVEGDIGRRVLALIDNGKAVRIYHTSPGTSATPTIRGSFKVYMKDPGTNAKGMYKSSYFIRGYAVHGYPSVPAGYSASHGCFRVPMADAATIYDFMSMGMPVDTY